MSFHASSHSFVRVAACSVVTLTLLAAHAERAEAQVLIASPPPANRFLAGPDYATDVLADPWDFSNPQDLSPDPNEQLGWGATTTASKTQGTSVFLNGAGQFAATSGAEGDPYVGLLYRGTHSTIVPGRSGLRFPIDPVRYRKLAIRVTYGSGPGGIAALYWFGRPDEHPNEDAGTGSTILGGVSAGTTTLVTDLASASPADFASPWSAMPVVGLRFDPTTNAGQAVSIDWVRLTAADADPGAARMNVRVTCGASNWTVMVWDGAVQTPVLTGASPANNLALSFNYGMFPPGTYDVRLLCNGNLLGSPQAFTIAEPPRVAVVSPAEAGGEDFASSPHYGGPSGAWDMEQAGDVAGITNVVGANLVAAPGGGAEMVGANLNTGNPVLDGDPQVYLLNDTNNVLPISSRRFHHLTFTLTVDGAYDLGAGSVARVLWGSDGQTYGATTTTSQDIKIFPGRNTYTVDLGALTTNADPVAGATIEFGCVPSCATTSWASRSIRFLRLDPHEFGTVPGTPNSVRVFRLDNVALRATDAVQFDAGQAFPIRWVITDPDNEFQTVRLFLDTDRNAAALGPQIGQKNNAGSNGLDQFNWVPSSTAVAPGEYYVYIQTTDQTGHLRGAYSEGRIRVFGPAGSPAITLAGPAAGDTVFSPFNVEGCALDSSSPSGTGVDEVLVHAIGSPTVADPNQRGRTIVLGHVSAFPEFGVLQTGLACPGAAPGSPGATAGFRVANVSALSAGAWTLRVFARSVATGVFTIQELPFVVDQRSGPARNLRLAAVNGNNITIAWDPPVEGRPITAYRIEVAQTPAFSPLAAQIAVPPHVTGGSGTLGNGPWLVRVITESAYTNAGPSSNVLSFALPGGTPAPPPLVPAAPAMHPAVVSGRNVTLSWSPAAGATSYALVARFAGSAAVIATLPGLTGTSAYVPNAPPGVYAVTVVAVNAAGYSAESNAVIVVVP